MLLHIGRALFFPRLITTLRGKMSWDSISPQDREALYQKRLKGELTPLDAFKYDIPFETLKRRLREYREVSTALDANALVARLKTLAPEIRSLEESILIEADDILICSDWHWPLTDARMIALLLLTAMKHGIRKLAIVGDTTNADEFSHWARKTIDDSPSFRSQMKSLSALLKFMLGWFTEIYISTGNHDERIQIKTEGHLSLADVLTLTSEDVEFSLYRYMWLKTSRELFLLIHPENYRAVSMALAQEFATRYVPPAPYENTTFGVMVAHTHVASNGYTKNALHPAIGLGCMFDPNLAAYKKRGGAAAVQWNRSFVMVKNGYVSMLTDEHTDWAFWLGDLYPALDRLVAGEVA